MGGYPGGFLLDWDPSKKWIATEKEKTESNPRFIIGCSPDICRPHDLLAYPDGKTIVLAGTPGYGYTGGGLLFWDRQTRTAKLVKHTDIIPDHSTMSLVALPDGKIIGGTTTNPGSGGERKAKDAELYIMDLNTKKVEWHQAIFPDTTSYTDLCIAPDGMVLGVADQKRFFVFDPKQKKIVHQENPEEKFGPTILHQGPRVFVVAPDAGIYMLFRKGIARVDGKFNITMLAESPVPITAGGDIYDGRIYFTGESRLYSYKLPQKK